MLRRLAVVAALLLASLSGCGGAGSTVVTAQFTDAAGLFLGNDVGVLGVRVGSVTRIEPRGDHVDVTLTIDHGVKVPADAGAVIVSRSVATDRYVELTPVYDVGPQLRSGAVLPVGRTRTPVEFDDLLRSVTDLSTSLTGDRQTTAPLQQLLSIGATTLRGKGATVGASLDDLATTLTTVDEASGDVTGTLDGLDRLTRTLAENDRLIGQFDDQVTSAVSMLDDQSDAIESTFSALSAMLAKVAAFSREHRETISRQIGDITELSDALLAHRAQLEQAVSTLPLMMQNVDRAIDDTDHLTMRTRPADLVPAAGLTAVLCEALPADVCAGLDLQGLTVLDILRIVAGERR